LSLHEQPIFVSGQQVSQCPRHWKEKTIEAFHCPSCEPRIAELDETGPICPIQLCIYGEGGSDDVMDTTLAQSGNHESNQLCKPISKLFFSVPRKAN
jgi:hypothetical protein